MKKKIINEIIKIIYWFRSCNLFITINDELYDEYC